MIQGAFIFPDAEQQRKVAKLIIDNIPRSKAKNLKLLFSNRSRSGGDDTARVEVKGNQIQISYDSDHGKFPLRDQGADFLKMGILALSMLLSK